MLPADLIKIAFYLFGVAPIAAAVLAFKGSPPVRTIARFTLLVAFLAYGTATITCLWLALGKRPSSGIGNGVFLLFTIPLTAIGLVWFALWRAARRYAYEQSLPPDLRRIEELDDIERAIESATKQLAAAERKVERWTISSEERERLRSEISLLKWNLHRLHQARAMRV
jgi:hypothetical protein